MNKEGYLQKSRAYKGFHYSVLKPDMLTYLHKRTLEIMRDGVIPIFNKYKIRYMICGGTLLGAATTGRFIPWDDDFDVCVFEEDYDKMIDCLIEELPLMLGDSVVVQCDKTEPHYYLDWVKIRDKKSHVYPDIPLYQENGVWIDIYKLVLVKEKDAAYRIAKGHLDYTKKRYEKGGLSKEEYENRVNNNNLETSVKIEHERSKNLTSENEVYVIWSASKVIVKKEWVLPLKSFIFEGVTVTSFNKTEEYLAQHYGEKYKNLPEDDLRRVGLNKIDYNL